MITVLIIIGCVLLYIISVWESRKWMSKAYSTNGIWGCIEPDYVDIIFIFCPGLNTVIFLVGFIKSPSHNDDILNKISKRKIE